MRLRGLILDLDGTVYAGNQEVPGAGDFIRACRARNIRCLFVTNRTNRMPAVVAGHLRGYGLPCAEEDVLTASQATAEALDPGPAYVIGEEGLLRPLADAGFTFTDRHPGVVIVGFDRAFSYEKLAIACRCIGDGAVFVGTNPDRALRLETGLSPGTGALVAAVQAGSGVAPVIIGKPERRIMDMALRRMDLAAGEVVAIGDNLETDILAGHAAGLRTALLLTGVSTAADIEHAAARPTWVAADYADLQRLLLD